MTNIWTSHIFALWSNICEIPSFQSNVTLHNQFSNLYKLIRKWVYWPTLVWGEIDYFDAIPNLVFPLQQIEHISNPCIVLCFFFPCSLIFLLIPYVVHKSKSIICFLLNAIKKWKIESFYYFWEELITSRKFLEHQML